MNCTLLGKSPLTGERRDVPPPPSAASRHHSNLPVPLTSESKFYLGFRVEKRSPRDDCRRTLVTNRSRVRRPAHVVPSPRMIVGPPERSKQDDESATCCVSLPGNIGPGARSSICQSSLHHPSTTRMNAGNLHLTCRDLRSLRAIVPSSGISKSTGQISWRFLDAVARLYSRYVSPHSALPTSRSLSALHVEKNFTAPPDRN